MLQYKKLGAWYWCEESLRKLIEFKYSETLKISFITPEDKLELIGLATYLYGTTMFEIAALIINSDFKETTLK